MESCTGVYADVRYEDDSPVEYTDREKLKVIAQGVYREELEGSWPLIPLVIFIFFHLPPENR